MMKKKEGASRRVKQKGCRHLDRTVLTHLIFAAAAACLLLNWLSLVVAALPSMSLSLSEARSDQSPNPTTHRNVPGQNQNVALMPNAEIDQEVLRGSAYTHSRRRLQGAGSNVDNVDNVYDNDDNSGDVDNDDDDGAHESGDASVWIEGEPPPAITVSSMMVKAPAAPRVLMCILAIAEAHSILRLRSQMKLWGTTGEVDTLIVAAGITLADIGVSEDHANHIQFLAMEEEFDRSGSKHLDKKVMEMWRRVYALYADKYDFFMKIDDDTYVNTQSLLAMLSYFNPDAAVYLGRRVGTLQCRRCRDTIPHAWVSPNSTPVGWFFFHGGGGYFISRRFLKELGSQLDGTRCLDYRKNWEDATFAICAGDLLQFAALPKTIGFDPFHNEPDQNANWRRLVGYAKQMETAVPLPSFLVHLTYHSMKHKISERAAEMRQRLLAHHNLSEDNLRRQLDVYWSKTLFNRIHVYQNIRRCRPNMMCASSYFNKRPLRAPYPPLRPRGGEVVVVVQTTSTLRRRITLDSNKILLNADASADLQAGPSSPLHANDRAMFERVVFLYLNKHESTETIRGTLGTNLKNSLVVIILTAATKNDGDGVEGYGKLLMGQHATSELLVLRASSSTAVYPPTHLMPSVTRNRRNERISPKKSYYGHYRRPHDVAELYATGGFLVTTGLSSLFTESTRFVHMHLSGTLLSRRAAVIQDLFSSADIPSNGATLFNWDKAIPPAQDCPGDNELPRTHPQLAIASRDTYEWYLLALMNAGFPSTRPCSVVTGVTQLAIWNWPAFFDVNIMLNTTPSFIALPG